MRSTTTIPPAGFPPTLVLGSSGRLGTMLYDIWRDRPVTWHARRKQENMVSFDILTDTCDLTAAIAGQRAVLCLAGIVPGKGDLALNTELACAVIQSAADAGGVPVFLTSSAAVYGTGRDIWHERDVAQPISDYGRAKLEMESAARQMAASLSVPVVSLRIANVAGADAILGGWKPGFQLDCMPDGRTPRRSYIGPHDLSDCLETLIRHDGDLPPVLNIARPGAVEMGALLQAAGLAWSPQPAGAHTIECVELATERLCAIHRFADVPNLADHIVDDWRIWTEARASG